MKTSAVCRLCLLFFVTYFCFPFHPLQAQDWNQKKYPFEWLGTSFITEQLLILNWCSFRIAQVLKLPDMFNQELTGTKRQKQIVQVTNQFASHKVFEGHVVSRLASRTYISELITHFQTIQTYSIWSSNICLSHPKRSGPFNFLNICRWHASNCTLPGTYTLPPWYSSSSSSASSTSPRDKPAAALAMQHSNPSTV